jgi:hypothetical protein
VCPRFVIWVGKIVRALRLLVCPEDISEDGLGERELFGGEAVARGNKGLIPGEGHYHFGRGTRPRIRAAQALG